jgi:hypothetical protein
MRFTISAIAVTALLFGAVSSAQDQPAAGKQALQQRVAELKQSLAANQAKLKKYQWLQTTTVSVKGEEKKEQHAQCRYGADGKVQKTPVGPTQEPKELPGGLRGKIAKKKVAEIKDYMQRLQSLIGHYAPPNPQRIQYALQANNAKVEATSGTATLTLTNYYKQGDKVSFIFDTAAKKLTNYNVDTYLDDPKKDIVTLANNFASLPDGTNYLSETVLDAQGKDIEIKTTNSGHSLIPQ